MGTIHKTFDIEIKEQRADGGRILISTGGLDRDNDRVIPEGGRFENYLKNPVVQWGHNYRDPWAMIGRTNSLEISPEGIIADFDLRPPANEQDPQNIVSLLWNGNWVRTASIGFDPRVKEWEENEEGGLNFTAWELLEWSLVPIPANQDALRLAVKGIEHAPIVGGSTWLPAVKETSEELAWIRQLDVGSDKGEQALFACFYTHDIDIPEGATKLDFDEDGDLVEVPHPDAGTTVKRKDVAFVPPIEFTSERWGDDACYSISGKTRPDEELVTCFDDEDWKVLSLSEVLLSMPKLKAWQPGQQRSSIGVCRLTRHVVEKMERIAGRLAKRNNEQQFEPASETDSVDNGSREDKSATQTDTEPTDDAPSDGNGGSVELTPEEETVLAVTLRQFLDTIEHEVKNV